MKIKAHPKMLFVAPHGKIILEADYSGQELFIAAVLSKDPRMVDAFTCKKTLVTPSGIEYPNPKADLHLISSMQCIDPEWFIGYPDHKLLDRANEVPPKQKSSPRGKGKTLNFASIYLSSAQSIAERNRVALKTAEEWNSRHRTTYAVYYDWAAEVGRIATARGWMPNARGRVRWVA